MSCIVLIGGIIGCGKTTLINFIRKNKTIFESITVECNGNSCRNNLSNEKSLSRSRNLFKIAVDDLCSIQEQAELMKTIKGWRNFRVDLLMASEHFITSSSDSECKVVGPLSERSQSLLQMLKKLNDSINVGSNGIFFVEDNFYYRSMRYEWFQIAKRANVGFCEVFLQCPINVAINRNSTRGYNIPEQKIRMMMSCMEFPSPAKYKWEKYSVLFDSSIELQSSSLKEMLYVIEEAAKNPAELMITEEKVEAQRVCSKNAIHQADKILRKLISKKISYFKENSLGKEDLKSIISSAINIRQELLNGIRQGYVCISEHILENLKNSGIESIQNEYEKCLDELFENAWHKKMAELNRGLEI